MNDDKWSHMEDRLKDEAAERGERFHSCTHQRSEEEEHLSPCCDAPIHEDTDICSDCKDHC